MTPTHGRKWKVQSSAAPRRSDSDKHCVISLCFFPSFSLLCFSLPVSTSRWSCDSELLPAATAAPLLLLLSSSVLTHSIRPIFPDSELRAVGLPPSSPPPPGFTPPPPHPHLPHAGSLPVLISPLSPPPPVECGPIRARRLYFFFLFFLSPSG